MRGRIRDRIRFSACWATGLGPFSTTGRAASASVRFRQTVTFAESEIVDWMYMDGNLDDGKLYGAGALEECLAH